MQQLIHGIAACSVLNVIASGAQHKRFFDKMCALLTKIFSSDDVRISMHVFSSSVSASLLTSVLRSVDQHAAKCDS